MVTREELTGKTQQEIEKMLDTDVQAFAAEVMEMADESTIINKEQEIMALMDENDARLKVVEYDVPNDCVFDNQNFNKQTVCKYIIDFINTQEVDWNYTLGLYDLVNIWKNKDLTKIKYHIYDSTLRILGQCKYKGYESWKKIMVVNSFMSKSHEDYVRDTAYVIYLSALHNTLLEALKKFEELKNMPREEQAENTPDMRNMDTM